MSSPQLRGAWSKRQLTIFINISCKNPSSQCWTFGSLIKLCLLPAQPTFFSFLFFKAHSSTRSLTTISKIFLSQGQKPGVYTTTTQWQTFTGTKGLALPKGSWAQLTKKQLIERSTRAIKPITGPGKDIIRENLSKPVLQREQSTKLFQQNLRNTASKCFTKQLYPVSSVWKLTHSEELKCWKQPLTFSEATEEAALAWIITRNYIMSSIPARLMGKSNPKGEQSTLTLTLAMLFFLISKQMGKQSHSLFIALMKLLFRLLIDYLGGSAVSYFLKIWGNFIITFSSSYPLLNFLHRGLWLQDLYLTG